MHDNQEVFTITLIVDGDDTRLLLSTSETPAKEDDEASGVIYKTDLPDQFEEIISKIPRLKDASEEEGSEETVTHTVEDFTDLYDLDLLDLIEQGEEILHTDLDDDDEESESEEHSNEVLGQGEPSLDDSESSTTEPFDIYREDEDFNQEDALAHIDPREALEKF